MRWQPALTVWVRGTGVPSRDDAEGEGKGLVAVGCRRVEAPSCGGVDWGAGPAVQASHVLGGWCRRLLRGSIDPRPE